jgi:hypothetical protein
MTIYDIYTGYLTEINKNKAPALYPQDFMYYLNKTLVEYHEAEYNSYETLQRTTDNLSHFEVTAELASLDAILPDDYNHLTSCYLYLEPNATYANHLILCGKNPRDYVKKIAVLKETADQAAAVTDNAYLQATWLRPYYKLTLPNIRINVGNKPHPKFQFSKVEITYLQPAPQYTLGDLALPVGDNSTNLNIHYKLDVQTQILNMLVTKDLERSTNPRLQTQPVVNFVGTRQGDQK